MHKWNHLPVSHLGPSRPVPSAYIGTYILSTSSNECADDNAPTNASGQHGRLSISIKCADAMGGGVSVSVSLCWESTFSQRFVVDAHMHRGS